MKLKSILPLIIPFVLGTSPAKAQDQSGYYAKAFGGLSALQGDSLSLGSNVSELSFSMGPIAGAAFGYDYAQSPFRSEVEYAYRSGNADSFTGDLDGDGDFASTSLMLNGYYFFETTNPRFAPYAGLGIGFATEIDFDIEGGVAGGEYSDRGIFAFQAMLGAEYTVSDRVSIYGEARYYSAGTPDLVGPANVALNADYSTLDVLAGIALRF